MSRVNQERVNRVLQRMAKDNVEQIIITSPVSMRYLTGEYIDSSWERCGALYLNNRGNITAVINQLQKYIQIEGANVIHYHDTEDPIAILAKQVLPGKLGVDKQWPARYVLHLMELCPNNPLINGSPYMDMTRMVKEPEEQEKLRLSSAMNDRVVAKSIQAIQEGLSEVDLAEKVNEFFAAEGAAVRNLCLVQFGENCAIPHHGAAKDVFLKPGDNVLFDIGKNLNGYYSDMTRTVVYKEATDFQKEIYDIVLQANLAAIDAVKAGVRACDVDAAARDIITKAGYGEYFTHRTGHNIGIEVHEWPDIAATNEMPLEAGMCFSIEPGIYIPGKIGVRIEDLVIVTENGCENLNHYTKEFQVIK
ncbi:MAG: aminopeptidase P family protein [Oscillospiraceae bacterium]|nr:aminopeptidase P family protein [Oscillospiraceae bacterium]MBR2637065.1 aminopeptidase P family protein [Oscillospiraceae bacterium]